MPSSAVEAENRQPQLTDVKSIGFAIPPTAPPPSISRADQPPILLLIWTAGFLVVTIPWLVAIAASEVERRRSQTITRFDWSLLIDQLRETLEIRRRIQLLESPQSQIPLTWGFLRPVVLLPQEACAWPDQTRRLVLLHELAHIKRYDVPLQLAARFATALYWFHPLAWYAFHRLKLESEHACDDCVVNAGESSSDYAQQLLEIARSCRAPRFSASIAMARANTLEQRMIALFDESNSHEPINHRSGLTLMTGSAFLWLTLSMIHPGPRAAAPSPAPLELEPPTAEKAAAPTQSEPAPQPVQTPQKTAKHQISGKVVRSADRTIAAGAEVVLLLPPPKGQDNYTGKMPLRRSPTAKDGSFLFDDLEPGRYRVWANFESLSSRRQRFSGEAVLISQTGENPKPLTLELAPAVTLTVRIKDKSTAKPIANASVSCSLSDMAETPRTDATGLVRLQALPPGEVSIRAWAPAFGKVIHHADLRNPSERDQEFLLGPGGTIEGIVRNMAGKPLSSGVVVPRLRGSEDQFSYIEADAYGHFQILNVPLEEPLEIHARALDHERKEIPFTLHTITQTLDFALAPNPDGGSITGIVLDPRGNPVASAHVKNMGSNSGDFRETSTGPDGRFRIDNLYDSVLGKNIVVRAKQFSPQRVQVTAGTRENPKEIKVTLDSGTNIEGRVVDEYGKPIDHVLISVCNPSWSVAEALSDYSDANGRFAFDSLDPESTFDLMQTGFSRIIEKKLPLGTNGVVDVVMRPAGMIKGKVLDSRTRKPIHKFKVTIGFSKIRNPTDPRGWLPSSHQNPGTTVESPTGEFQITNELIEGLPLEVSISAVGYRTEIKERVVAAVPDEAMGELFRLDPLR